MLKSSSIVPTLHLSLPGSRVPLGYRPLHKYLNDRFADTVVLSFSQIESLLDSPLPPLAHSVEWWMSPSGDGAHSAQSLAWTEANRTASPNLPARHVVFERQRVR